MEIRQIQYFIEVAKREHVTEAAAALHVAQSAVSRQIFKLESELGVDLFIREGRNVKLTPIGRSFLDNMQVAMQVIEQAKQEVDEFLDPNRGTIRIGFPSSLASYLLPTVVSAFRENHPNVNFKLQHGSYHELIRQVINGDINLALLGPVPKHEKQIKGETLFFENIVALLPISHHLAEASSIRLNQLQNESFVLFPEGFILHEIVVNACKDLGFQPNISFAGDDIDAIKGLVAAGLGVTLLPEVTLNDNIPRSTVKVAISEPSVNRGVGVIIPSKRELSPSEKIFYDFLKQFFAELNRYKR